MGKVQNVLETAEAKVTGVEQTIREKIAEALAASGLNVQIKHAENIADRIEAIVEAEVAKVKAKAGWTKPDGQAE